MTCSIPQWIVAGGPMLGGLIPLVPLTAYLLFICWVAHSEDGVVIALYAPLVTLACGVMVFRSWQIYYELGSSIDPGMLGQSRHPCY